MKALRTITDYAPGMLMNPGFRYKRAIETDVRKTFERVRKQQAKQKAQMAAGGQAQLALPMVTRNL